MKRMAVIVGGWHYSYHFYEMIAKQKIPNGWEIDLFVIGHREPPGIKNEKDLSYYYDRKLYERFVEVDDLNRLNWKYNIMPNKIGDLFYVNQWLSLYDYHKYNIIHFSHDDNYIRSTDVFQKILTDEVQFYKKDNYGVKTIKTNNKDWLILSNSTSESFYHVRVSSIFFKKEIFDLLDDGFDLSDVKLDRTGKIDTPKLHSALSEWNKTVGKLNELIKKFNLYENIRYISPYYRVSPYCIEGERGMISKKTCWIKEFEIGMKKYKYEKL